MREMKLLLENGILSIHFFEFLIAHFTLYSVLTAATGLQISKLFSTF